MQMLFVTIIKVPTKCFQAVFYEGTSDKSAIKSRQTEHPFYIIEVPEIPVSQKRKVPFEFLS